MRWLFAILSFCIAASAQAAPGGDIVLFKANAMQRDYVANSFEPEPPAMLVEGAVFRFRLDVKRVLIGDLPVETISAATITSWDFKPGPKDDLYVLARKLPQGGIDIIDFGLAEHGLCIFPGTPKYLGIDAEWRAQSAMDPCKDQ